MSPRIVWYDFVVGMRDEVGIPEDSKRILLPDNVFQKLLHQDDQS